MDLFQLAILALVQGITEFLPISSSGHLIIVHRLLDTPLTLQQERILDVSVHIGTLFSVLIYFRKEVLAMLGGLVVLVKSPRAAAQKNAGSQLFLMLLVGSIPVMVAGLVLAITKPCWIGTVELVAWPLLIFSGLLYWADRTPRSHRTVADMTFRDALIVGLAQMLALIPGTSRAGITMTAARFCGYTREEAARFSLLLGMIAIAMAGALSTLELLQAGDGALIKEAVIAAAIAFATGYAVISLMMRWLRTYSYTPFVIYRVLLAIFLLSVLYLPSLWPELHQLIAVNTCAK